MSADPLMPGVPLECIPPMSQDRFLEISGLSAVSLWRFEKRGWIKTHLISNRRYVMAKDIAEFNRRLEAGEFAGAERISAYQRGKMARERKGRKK